MIQFHHLDLERSKGNFQGHEIEIKKNVNVLWDIWVDGNLTKPKSFGSRKSAIAYCHKIMNKILTRQARPLLFSPNHQGTSRTRDAS